MPRKVFSKKASIWMSVHVFAPYVTATVPLLKFFCVLNSPFGIEYGLLVLHRKFWFSSCRQRENTLISKGKCMWKYCFRCVKKYLNDFRFSRNISSFNTIIYHHSVFNRFDDNWQLLNMAPSSRRLTCSSMTIYWIVWPFQMSSVYCVASKTVLQT